MMPPSSVPQRMMDSISEIVPRLKFATFMPPDWQADKVASSARSKDSRVARLLDSTPDLTGRLALEEDVGEHKKGDGNRHPVKSANQNGCLIASCSH